MAAVWVGFLANFAVSLKIQTVRKSRSSDRSIIAAKAELAWTPQKRSQKLEWVDTRRKPCDLVSQPGVLIEQKEGPPGHQERLV